MGVSQSHQCPRLPVNAKEKPKRYSFAERRIIRKYLASFPFVEKSTEHHRQVAGKHWDLVFGKKPKSNAKAEGRSGGGHQSEKPNNKITELYDIFYHYLEEHGSELKHVFRSSMHVRGRVLVHISAGMRAMLGSDNVMDKIAMLTKTHRRFGVKPHHYDLVGSALLFAMEKTSGQSNWSSDINDSWRNMFTHASVILIRDQLRDEKKHEKAQAKAAKIRDRGLGSTVGSSVMTMQQITHQQRQTNEKRVFWFNLHIPSIRSRSSVRDCSSATTTRSMVSHKTTARSGRDD
jgi:hemoglobin-like flavoprotein